MKLFSLNKLFAILLIGSTLVSCGSSEEDEPTPVEDASLELSVGGNNFTANFDGSNAAIIAVTSPNIDWTSITLGGTTTSGETITLALAFNGKSAGTSTVTGAAGQNSLDPTGFSLALVPSGTSGTIYQAVSVTVNISSYIPVSGGVTALVKGTFSGTVKDEDGNQFNLSGSFNTGPLG